MGSLSIWRTFQYPPYRATHQGVPWLRARIFACGRIAVSETTNRDDELLCYPDTSARLLCMAATIIRSGVVGLLGRLPRAQL